EGLDTIRRRRRGRPDRELTSGPAKLAQALAIGPDLQRHRLTEPPLFIAEGEAVPTSALVRATRVGISKGREKKWRFYDRRSAFVSRRAPGK
ncbi:MAG: DNA-3-methyladenine glycosylase, partial [Planctomycetota bacterium]